MRPWVWTTAVVLLGYLWVCAHTPEVLHKPLGVVVLVVSGWVWLLSRHSSSSKTPRPSEVKSGQRSFAFLGGSGPNVREQIAVHEAAHFLATKSAGFRSNGAEYYEDGGRSHIGYRWWGGQGSTDDIIATLAGMSMEMLWLQREHGYSYRKARAIAEPHAQADFQQLPRSILKRGRDGYLRIDSRYTDKADKFVKRNYDQIMRNAEVMVKRGRISEVVD